MLKSIILGLLFTALIIEVLLMAPSVIKNSPQADVKKTEARIEDGYTQIMKGVEVQGIKDQRKDWELKADEGRAARSTGSWHLSKIKARFFTENGDHFDVQGLRGHVDVATKNMTVDGQVFVKSSNGYIFRSEKFSYDSRSRTISCPDKVDMKGPAEAHNPGLSLRGGAMKADLAHSFIYLENGVQGEKGLPHDRQMKIKSNSAEFMGNSYLAKFKGRVVIDVEAMRISGPQADFLYDNVQKQVTMVEVKGGVKVTDQEKWATADSVSFDLTNEKFVFQGSPRLVQNNDELRGDLIVFLEGGKRVQVRGAKARVDETRMEKVN